jgi:hypothetical protein
MISFPVTVAAIKGENIWEAIKLFAKGDWQGARRGTVASPAPLFSSCGYLPLMHSRRKRITIRS